MAANTVPIFIKTPNTSSVRLTSADTTHDGSLATTAFTAGADGSRVDYIVATASSTTAGNAAAVARVFRVYITDTSGNNPRLRAEIALSAATASNTVIAQTGTITFTNGLILKSGQLLKVSVSAATNTTDTLDVVVHGGDY